MAVDTVDMQTLLHQGTRHQNKGRAEALAEARAQVLAGIHGSAEAKPGPAPEQTDEAESEQRASEPTHESQAESGQADDAPESEPTPESAPESEVESEVESAPASEQTNDETESEPEAEPEPADVETDAADAEPEPVLRSETPARPPAVKAPSEAGDMDVQLDFAGTDRAQSATSPIAVAAPPRRGKPKAGASADGKAPTDTKQVRGIAQATVIIACQAFPTLSIGDAINAYVAWKAGDVSGLSPDVAALVRERADDEADPAAECARRLAALEKKLDKQARSIGELEVYTVFVMLDRLGFRPAGAIATPADLDLSCIKDVPTVMPKLAKQADEICRKVAVKQGRPRSQAPGKDA